MIQKYWNIHVTATKHILVTCERLTLADGQVQIINSTGQSNGRYLIDTTVSFRCTSRFFHLFGSGSSTCQHPGTWTPRPPTCQLGNKRRKFTYFSYMILTWHQSYIVKLMYDLAYLFLGLPSILCNINYNSQKASEHK